MNKFDPIDPAPDESSPPVIGVEYSGRAYRLTQYKVISADIHREGSGMFLWIESMTQRPKPSDPGGEPDRRVALRSIWNLPCIFSLN